MSERVKCRTKDCTAMILAATAERTGGLCMPCKKNADRIKDGNYIRENKRDVDPYEGVSDRVEILKIMHQPKKNDPLINYLPYKKKVTDLYEELNENELQRLIQYTIDNIDSTVHEAVFDIIKEISAFTDANIFSIIKKLIEIKEYYPGYMFRAAGADIASRLIERIDLITKSTGDHSELNLILEALAWIGTEDVISLFGEWKRNPPKWAKRLYLPPENYAHYAGWELNTKFERRKLILEKCYPLIKISDRKEVGPVKTCTKSNELCKWCGRNITKIFEFDLTEKKLNFIPFSGNKLTIATCEVCSAFSDQLYMTAGPNGESTWSSHSVRPESLPGPNEEFVRLPTNKLKLSTKPRLLNHSVDWCLPSTFSQVGGMPSWIQDTAYGQCPKCNRSMIFIAQLSVEDIEEYGEGIFYGLLCSECSISSVRYQQT